jgi:hypothetical protein
MKKLMTVIKCYSTAVVTNGLFICSEDSLPSAWKHGVWSPKLGLGLGLGLKKSWLSYTLTQNYQSMKYLWRFNYSRYLCMWFIKKGNNRILSFDFKKEKIEISEIFCEMLTSLEYKCVNKQTRWVRVRRVFKVQNFRSRTSEKSADSDSDVRKALIKTLEIDMTLA